MARVNHKKVKQLIQERRGKISDREFFTSRLLALHFEDIAAAQTKRYGSHRPVRVHLTWEPDASHAACTNNLTIHINVGNPIITQFSTREERYQMMCGLFAHELGHCLYTDFLASQTYGQEISACRWYPEPPALTTVKDRVNERALWDYAQAEPENLPLLARVAHEAGNVLEDASIENRILEAFPGTLGQSLDFLREWQWNDMPTVTQLKEREAQGQPMFFSLLQLFLSYGKFGELKYGEEPFTEEHIRTVFELLPELDEDLQSRSGKERWKTVNTILIRCWEQVREYVEAIKRQHQEDKAAGNGGSVFSKLEQNLSSLTGGSARGKGDTAPISGGPGPGSPSPRREKTRALAKQAGGGQASSPKGAALSMGEAGQSYETGKEDSSKQEVTAQEKGRMPLVETDAISQPMGGRVERNNSYTPELSKTVEAEMGRLLTHMAEQEVCQELEENRLSELNEFAKGISYGNAHKGVEVEINRMAAVDPEIIAQYNAMAGPLLAISRQLQKSILQQLKDRQRGGKQTGLLFGRRLDAHALYRDDGKVFYKNALPNDAPQMVVGLLLDESGSMSSGDRATYRIALYRPCEAVKDAAGKPVSEVKAVGYCLPTGERQRFDLRGHWSRDSKYGVQFEVEDYQQVIVPTKEGILAYLSSGQIKGIGPKTAEKIYHAFGNDTLNILDEEPHRLLEVKGISQTKLQRIRDSYLASRGARDVVAFLAPHGVSPNRAVKLYREFGKDTLDILKNHPYRLCELAGIGFRTADKIAQSLGLDPRSPERVDAALLYTLQEAEQRGHLCLDKREFLKLTLRLLDTPGLTELMVAARASRLVEERKLVSYHKWVYRWPTAQAEVKLARQVSSMLSFKQKEQGDGLSQRLAKIEGKLGLSLNGEQRQAVLTALMSPITILTGGPGTGKTMTQKALLALYREIHPEGKIVCCAPTGRAARRMEESTGVEASTIHKALKLIAGEDGAYAPPEPLDADLVLVDEVSMMDIYLAGHLFHSLPPGCQLVLVGDADQLPSVGPGAVLSELIACGRIPVVRLSKIYRQSSGSRIAANAMLIRNGNLHLEYGSDFQFYECADLRHSADMVETLYLQEAARLGVDNVALLSPFRKRTETGVDALNLRLQEKVNPPDQAKPELPLGKRLFRLGDKVMQVKNYEDVSNGDIGKVTEVDTAREEPFLTVDFGDGRVKEYARPDLDRLDLAYAATIHKSQGSEYHTVIVNLQCAHAVMLTRPLLYTAITRAKMRVILVGERKALCMAIRRTDAERRGTRLAARIQEELQKREGN